MKKGTHCSSELKEKLRNIFKGRKLKEEHRLKVIRTLSSSQDQRGDKNPQWKGGRTNHDGYIWVKNLEHPFKNSQGYVSEHRLVMEKAIGRYLLPIEHVHHLNENKKDNKIENLRIVNPQEHGNIHWATDESKKKQSEFMKQKRNDRFWSTKKKIIN